MTLSHQVRATRLALGWSQDTLADHADVSRPTITRVERGDDVSMTSMAKIASALGLTMTLTHLAPCEACIAMKKSGERHPALEARGEKRIVQSMGKHSDEQDYRCTICGKDWMHETGDTGYAFGWIG